MPPSVARAQRARATRYIQPALPPPAYTDASRQSSRQSSPLVLQPSPARSYIRRLLLNGLKASVPVAAYYVGKYSKPIHNTIRDIANYGKRMTINALAAIKNTPYHEEQMSSDSSRPSTPIPAPTPTAIPRPTPDKQHPRTSVQIYN